MTTNVWAFVRGRGCRRCRSFRLHLWCAVWIHVVFMHLLPKKTAQAEKDISSAGHANVRQVWVEEEDSDNSKRLMVWNPERIALLPMITDLQALHTMRVMVVQNSGLTSRKPNKSPHTANLSTAIYGRLDWVG